MTNQLTQSIIEAINKHLSLGSNLKSDEISIESAEQIINGEYTNAMKLYKELVSDLIAGSNNYRLNERENPLLELWDDSEYLVNCLVFSIFFLFSTFLFRDFTIV